VLTRTLNPPRPTVRATTSQEFRSLCLASVDLRVGSQVTSFNDCFLRGVLAMCDDGLPRYARNDGVWVFLRGKMSLSQLRFF
jgi:hypothetical protein